MGVEALRRAGGAVAAARGIEGGLVGRLYIGTSGWTYRIWRQTIYSGVPQRAWLQRYTSLFDAVEVNATFYRLLKRATFEKWRDETPDRFRFAIKGNRYVTHVRRLADPAEGVRLERERASALGQKLTAVVWQLPPGLSKDMARLREFAEALQEWQEARHAVEFRNPSWFDSETADCLAAHRLAVCMSDAAGWPMWREVTTDLVYVRLHGHSRTYRSAYSDALLRSLAVRVREWRADGCIVHVYFDNTDEGNAPGDAARLTQLLADGEP